LTCCLLTASALAWGAEAFDLSASPAHPSMAGKSRRLSLATEELDRLREVLAGSDQTAIVTAMRALGDGGAANAAPLLVEVLARGAPTRDRGGYRRTEEAPRSGLG
jgi:cell division GTPase FtsZ